MRRTALALALAALLAGSPATGSAAAPPPAAPSAPPVEVMVVGLFHLNNPGRDLHNLKVDDVLAPGRQAELARISAGLARFRPTRVMVEQDAPVTVDRWAKFQAGTLPPSRGEAVQLGFRLAKATGAQPQGVDADGDFPYPPVEAWAKAHGRTAQLDAANAQIEADVRTEAALLAGPGGVPAVLRWMNDPARIAAGYGFYGDLVKMGGGAEQPGAELLAAWTRRNLLICANIVQAARPGDRVVVIYGAGHAFPLRRCLSDTPGFKLVEAEGYLPR